MSKIQQIIEHIVVTFIEAAIAYVVVIPNPSIGKTTIAGAVGAGLSAVYNYLRQSAPTIVDTAPSAPVVPQPVEPPVEPVAPVVG